ncbi:MAG TPA: PadR family transcriptional regulator [Gemmatimonadaceae bacterium]
MVRRDGSLGEYPISTSIYQLNRTARLTYPTAIVLVAIANGYRYGFEIIDATGLGAGTVYPILRRLDDGGLLRSSWEAAVKAVDRPPRRYYRLNAGGALAVREAVNRYPGLAGFVPTPRSADPTPA